MTDLDTSQPLATQQRCDSFRLLLLSNSGDATFAVDCPQHVQESPTIRYRAVAPEQAKPALAAGALVAQRMAVRVHDQLLEMQKAGQMPVGEGIFC